MPKIHDDLLKEHSTEHVIHRLFHGDTEDAAATAEHIVKTQATPPTWARELAGPTAGWKDTTGRWRF